MRKLGDIGGKAVAFTDHALARMVEMKVTVEEIQGLLCDPEETFQSEKYPGEICHRKGKYSVALVPSEEGTLVVKTILYSSLEDWCEAAKNGELTDRTLKPDTGIPRRRRRDA